MSSQYPTDLDEELGALDKGHHTTTLSNYDSLLGKDYDCGSLDPPEPQFSLPSNVLGTTSQSAQISRFVQKTRKNNEMLRERILMMRLGLRAERAELRRQESAKAEADDRLIRFINRESSNLLASSKGLQQLAQLQLQCQRIRNSYGPREDEYRQREEDLENLEDKLSRGENRLYNYLSKMPTDDLFWAGGVGTPSIASSRSSSSTEYPALLSEYLSNLGDLSILKERYDTLQTDKERLEDQREIRRFANVSLSPEDQKFLENFQAASDDLLREILRLQRTCDNLQKECLDGGLLAVDSSTSSSASSTVSSSASSVPVVSRCTTQAEKNQDRSLVLNNNDFISCRPREVSQAGNSNQ